MLSRPIPQPKPRTRLAEKRAKRQGEQRKARRFRDIVWKRSGGLCSYCWRRVLRGSPDMLLRGEVHHRIPRSRSKAKRFDPQNGVVLCVECHGRAQRHEIRV